jgi:hypothetical protein
MWVPGYWAYDYDSEGYYWVPGAWVPAPYEGALWTPPYWGWDNGFYAFHAGYWGPMVGYYGGVNYGFGYMGVGFVGGEWHEHHFFYNTAIVNVNRTYIHNTYINNTIVRENTIVNNNHIAYNGGPRGIQHMPTPEERNAMQMPHSSPTRFQDLHTQDARSDRQNFFNANHGRPQTVAISRPLAAEHVQAPNAGDARRGLPMTGGLSGSAPETRNRPIQPLNGTQNRPQYNPRPNVTQPNVRQNDNGRIIAAPVNQQPQRGFGNIQQAQPERTMQQQSPINEYQPNGNRPQQPQPRFDQQSRIQPIPSYRPAPQQQYRPEPQQSRPPQPQPQYHPQPQQQRAPEFHPAPQTRSEYRPHK